MADETTKKILIDVQLKSTGLKEDVISLNSTLDKLLTTQIKLRGAGQQNSAQFIDLQSQIRNTKTAIRDANKDIDNISKAINAENNSIQQNRALLSLLTKDYVKLGQEEGKTSEKTVALGKTINDLTEKLKVQEKQIGQTYRNVGNYADSLVNSIPGVQKYSSAITQAAQAFNVMGSSAEAGGEEATTAVEGVGATLSIVTAGVALLTVGIGQYLDQFAHYSDNFTATWEGIKANFKDIENTIANGNFANFFKKSNVAQDAHDASIAMSDLARQSLNATTLTKEEDAQIAVILLKIRNKGTDGVEAEKLYQQALALTNQQYERNNALAKSAYTNTVLAATSGYNLTKDQIKGLTDLSKGYKVVVDYAKQLVDLGEVNKDFLEKLNPAIQAIIDTDAKQQRKDQLLKNRADAKQAKDEERRQKELQAQEKYNAQQLKLQQEIDKGIKESDSERIASYTRTIQTKQEAFGKELSMTAEHYRQLIFKQEEFITKEQNIQNNPKNSAKTKGMAGKAITAGKADITQLKAEQYATLQQMLEQHNKAILSETQKAAIDLLQLQNKSIEDTTDREIRVEEIDFKSKQEDAQRQIDLIKETIGKVKDEIKTADTATKVELKKELDAQQELLEIALDKRTETLLQHQEKIKEINKAAADKKLLTDDKIKVLDSDPNNYKNPFNDKLQDAKQKQLLDQYHVEVNQKGLTEEAKSLIEKEYLAKSKEMTKQNEQEKKDEILKGVQLVANTALTIIDNANKARFQREEMQISKNKDRELANTALTSSQKLAINEKYRVIEGKQKVKEFNAEKKLNLAKAAIAGAVAVIKALPNPFLVAAAIATTVAETAVILSQQPPAYAKGGIHSKNFKSDGKGSILPGYSKKDNVNAQLRSGEAVIVSEAARDPYARNILSAINVAYGGRPFSQSNPGNGYAIGGIVTDGNNSNRYYAQPQQGTENLANSIAFSLINNFPPIIADIKDINNQQGILMNTVNRVNL